MEPDTVNDARSRVENRLGRVVAQKASDTFCLVFGHPAGSEAALERVSPHVAGRSVVLELTAQPAVADAIERAVEALRQTRAWAGVRRTLQRTTISQVTAGRVTEVMETGRSEPEILPVQAARLLRHAKIVSLRDNFAKITGPITAEIERSTRSFIRPFVEAAGGLPPSSPTQMCWLNRSLRAYTDPRALAEVASDASIEVLDVPRRLERELDVTRNTVGVPPFRKRFKGTGEGIIVAVIDSEVAISHPALKGRVAHRKNYTEELWGNPDAHGTAVAGIIASGDGGFGGMAPGATIYNYKVLATSPALNGDDFDGTVAIQQALEDGAHLANCSWGAGPAGDGTSREARACDTAWGLGLIIVKSAGNRGPGARTLTTPADAEGVIVVGAAEREGTAVQNYSSRGPAGPRVRPHLVAPGGVLDGRGVTSCLVGGGFGDVGAGTSFAAPHVSGLLALLLHRDPRLIPEAARALLLDACEPLAVGDANTQGSGLVSLEAIA